MWQLSAQVDVEEIEDGGIAEPDPGVADQAQAAAEAVAVAEQPQRELHSFEIDSAQVGPLLAKHLPRYGTLATSLHRAFVQTDGALHRYVRCLSLACTFTIGNDSV